MTENVVRHRNIDLGGIGIPLREFAEQKVPASARFFLYAQVLGRFLRDGPAKYNPIIQREADTGIHPPVETNKIMRRLGRLENAVKRQRTRSDAAIHRALCEAECVLAALLGLPVMEVPKISIEQMQIFDLDRCAMSDIGGNWKFLAVHVVDRFEKDVGRDELEVDWDYVIDMLLVHALKEGFKSKNDVGLQASCIAEECGPKCSRTTALRHLVKNDTKKGAAARGPLIRFCDTLRRGVRAKNAAALLPATSFERDVRDFLMIEVNGGRIKNKRQFQAWAEKFASDLARTGSVVEIDPRDRIKALKNNIHNFISTLPA
jgi:hypothetical protein